MNFQTVPIVTPSFQSIVDKFVESIYKYALKCPDEVSWKDESKILILELFPVNCTEKGQFPVHIAFILAKYFCPFYIQII